VRAVTFRCELGHIALTVEPLHLALRLPSPAPSWAVDWAQKFVGRKTMYFNQDYSDLILREVEDLACRVLPLKRRLAKQM
jgi:hypothetical protein